MNPHSLLSLFLLTLLSCSPQAEQDRHEKLSTTTADSTVPFNGIWLNDVYLESLMKTKSPKQSQGVAEITSIQIPKSLDERVLLIFDFHESVDVGIDRKEGGYEIEDYKSDNPTPKKCFVAQDGRLKIGDQTFTKMNDPAASCEVSM